MVPCAWWRIGVVVEGWKRWIRPMLCPASVPGVAGLPVDGCPGGGVVEWVGGFSIHASDNCHQGVFEDIFLKCVRGHSALFHPSLVWNGIWRALTYVTTNYELGVVHDK